MRLGVVLGRLRVPALILVVVVGGLWVASRWWSPVAPIGGVQVALRPVFVTLTTASEPVVGNGERWRFSSGATVILGPQRIWLPSRQTGVVSTTSWGGRVSTVFVPWRFMFLSAVLVGLLPWLLGRRPASPGRCAGCGYDLSGSPSGRCPECGVADTRA